MIKQALLIVITIACCNSVFSQTDEKGIILGIERSVADAYTKHNVMVLNSAFTDDATIISATGAVMTKQQLLQSTQTVYSATVSDLKVRIEGAIAIVTGTEVETGKDNVGSYSNTMRFTDILQKSNNEWKIFLSQATAVKQ